MHGGDASSAGPNVWRKYAIAGDLHFAERVFAHRPCLAEILEKFREKFDEERLSMSIIA